MATTPPDPFLEDEPDFTSEAFAAARQILIDAGIPQETAVQATRDSWVAHRQIRHIAWVQARQEEEAGHAEAERRRTEEEEARRREEEEERARNPPNPGRAISARAIDDDDAPAVKLPAYPMGIGVPPEETLRPSEFARQKLIKREYTELWYFTREGCAEALRMAHLETSDANDLFTFARDSTHARNNDSIRLKAYSGAKPSPNAKNDMLLTWDQMVFAARKYIATMREERWPEDYVKGMLSFFFNLDHIRSQRGYNVDAALLEYQATIRREWFDALRRKEPFDIAHFSQERFSNIQSRLTLEKHEKALVCTPLKH